MTEQLFFVYFSGMTLASAIVAVASRSLVYSALSLLITFIHIAGIYILLNAEFLAAVQIIVYAGAILVLYLFVLMLFNPKGEERYLHRQFPVGIFLGLVVLVMMVLSVFRSEIIGQKGAFTPDVVQSIGHTQSIGQALYSDFILPFEVASLILLVAMLGAIILAGRRGKARKKTAVELKNTVSADEKSKRPDEVMV